MMRVAQKASLCHKCEIAWRVSNIKMSSLYQHLCCSFLPSLDHPIKNYVWLLSPEQVKPRTINQETTLQSSSEGPSHDSGIQLFVVLLFL